jgi:phenylacetate-coenzyme A ligase PaaK-like adenylate-forming protein
MPIDPYRPICRFVTTPLWAAWERSPYLRLYREQQRFQYWSADDIVELQVRRLRHLLEHAYQNTGYYKEMFDGLGCRPADIRTSHDFERVPLLTKTIVRERARDMVARNIEPRRLVPGMTSGSTGRPLEFFIDEPCLQHQRATALLTAEWAGYRRGARTFTMFGQSTSPPASTPLGRFRSRLRVRLLDRTTNLSTLELSLGAMRRFHSELMRAPRPFLVGYAHTLALFATFVADNRLAPIHCSGIISGGMPLHSQQRALLEATFRVRVTNRYGCEELGTIACQCERGGGLHVNSWGKIVELLDRRGLAVQPGVSGTIVATDLFNYGMPFIRYKMEDSAVKGHGECACGRGLPLFSALEGRDSDFVIRPDGSYVSGVSLTDNFGAKIPGVRQIQLVQNRVDHLLIRMVVDGSFGDESRAEVQRLVSKYFGETMRHTCELLPAIPLEPSGKVRFVISKLE